MKILLVNPPNCGRSIPEERYGIDTLKQIFRGEPLALETLAGNLDGHDVRIIDLKADPESLSTALAEFSPDIVGLTAVTCEANTVLKLARQIKEATGALTAVGGSHASSDPTFFNQEGIDFVVVGMGKLSFRELVDAIEQGRDTSVIPGVGRVQPGSNFSLTPRRYCQADLVENKPPRYDLVEQYRPNYTLAKLGLNLGFVSSAFGCPFDCSFCCISNQAGGRYLTMQTDSVIRDIDLLGDIPVIRLVDANTFGNPAHAKELCEKIRQSGIKKNYLADVRSDTVVKHPELLQQWKDVGLRSVIIGFEEISNENLTRMNKANQAETNREAIRILHEMGLTIVGDFIVSPDYNEDQFAALGRYLEDHPIDLPMLTVMTPLPGTPMYAEMKDQIIVKDLDYYTLTNAVVRTRLEEQTFYENYAALIRAGHNKAKI